MIKIKTQQVISVDSWDELVQNTYGRLYSFQQQDDCQERGNVDITVPVLGYTDAFNNNTVLEEVNGEEMGVSFVNWLDRDPALLIPNQKYDWELSMFWERNFYPDLQMVANDLHAKGLIPAGEYVINIDW